MREYINVRTLIPGDIRGVDRLLDISTVKVQRRDLSLRKRATGKGIVSDSQSKRT